MAVSPPPRLFKNQPPVMSTILDNDSKIDVWQGPPQPQSQPQSEPQLHPLQAQKCMLAAQLATKTSIPISISSSSSCDNRRSEAAESLVEVEKIGVAVSGDRETPKQIKSCMKTSKSYQGFQGMACSTATNEEGGFMSPVLLKASQRKRQDRWSADSCNIMLRRKKLGLLDSPMGSAPRKRHENSAWDNHGDGEDDVKQSPATMTTAAIREGSPMVSRLSMDSLLTSPARSRSPPPAPPSKGITNMPTETVMSQHRQPSQSQLRLRAALGAMAPGMNATSILGSDGILHQSRGMELPPTRPVTRPQSFKSSPSSSPSATSSATIASIRCKSLQEALGPMALTATSTSSSNMALDGVLHKNQSLAHHKTVSSSSLSPSSSQYKSIQAALGPMALSRTKNAAPKSSTINPRSNSQHKSSSSHLRSSTSFGSISSSIPSSSLMKGSRSHCSLSGKARSGGGSSSSSLRASLGGLAPFKSVKTKTSTSGTKVPSPRSRSSNINKLQSRSFTMESSDLSIISEDDSIISNRSDGDQMYLQAGEGGDGLGLRRYKSFDDFKMARQVQKSKNRKLSKVIKSNARHCRQQQVQQQHQLQQSKYHQSEASFLQNPPGNQDSSAWVGSGDSKCNATWNTTTTSNITSRSSIHKKHIASHPNHARFTPIIPATTRPGRFSSSSDAASAALDSHSNQSFSTVMTFVSAMTSPSPLSSDTSSATTATITTPSSKSMVDDIMANKTKKKKLSASSTSTAATIAPSPPSQDRWASPCPSGKKRVGSDPFLNRPRRTLSHKDSSKTSRSLENLMKPTTTTQDSRWESPSTFKKERVGSDSYLNRPRRSISPSQPRQQQGMVVGGDRITFATTTSPHEDSNYCPRRGGPSRKSTANATWGNQKSPNPRMASTTITSRNGVPSKASPHEKHHFGPRGGPSRNSTSIWDNHSNSQKISMATTSRKGVRSNSSNLLYPNATTTISSPVTWSHSCATRMS